MTGAPGALARLLLVALLVSACLSPPSQTPSPSPSPEQPDAPDAAARTAVSRFLVNWRIGRTWRMLELIAPADLANGAAGRISSLLTDFDALLGVSQMATRIGPAIDSSLPADESQGPQPALLFPVSFELETDTFGHLSYRRMLTVTDSPEGWWVRWQPRILFPGLRDRDTLALERVVPPRGQILAADGTVLATTREDGMRVYPEEWLAGQTIGWVSQLTEAEAVERRPAGYLSGDLVGRGGLEAGAEALLRGIPGFTLIGGAPNGERTVLLERTMEPGADLRTTLRPALQATAETAIAGYDQAATAVIDPATGDVWALASAPLFNPNAMTLGTTLAGVPLRAPTGAMRTNFAVEGTYPAGSSFKPFTLAAALRTGVAGPATRMPCQGTWLYDGFTFHNYADHSLPGSVSLVEAMAFSCNTTYMPLSIMVYEHDPAALTDLVAEFGFGQPTGIGWIREQPGALPDAVYFRTQPRWDGSYRGYGPFDQIQLAIGQGDYLGTALQLANAYAAFGNGGRLMVPRLVAGATLPDGRSVLNTAPRLARQVSLTAEQLAYIVSSMQAVIDLPYGTAQRAFAGFGIDVAGKSGTAETGTPRPNAWFPAFAPADAPQISVATVLVRVPLATGGSDAAPLVRRVMARYFADL